MVSPRRVALAVALATVVVTSGCVSGPLSEQQEDELVDRVESELGDVDGYEATITNEWTTNNETRTTRTHVKADLKNGRHWQKVLAPEERAGDLTVSNGSTTWNYDASEHAVRKYDGSLSSNASSGDVTRLLGDVTERYEIVLNGTESVDGTEAYVAELTPETDTQVSEMTVWLDQSTYFPVKVHQEIDLEDAEYEATIRYENVTLNPEFEADTFEYDPPADATVEPVDLPDTEQFDSPAGLEDATNYSVPQPDLPDDFAFDQGTITTHNGTQSASAAYSNGSATLRLGVYPGSQYSSDGDTVTVDGRDATVSSYADTTLVTWTCDGLRYTVTSTAGEDLALSAAASVTCE